MYQATQILSDMRQAGLRLTKTRRACIEVLTRSRVPLSAQRILQALRKKQVLVNKTTVYRELEKLEKRGIVQGVQLQERTRYFELATQAHHHHLVCLECEQVEDVDVCERELAQEERKVSEQKHFVVLRHSLEFFGLCQRCQCTL